MKFYPENEMLVFYENNGTFVASYSKGSLTLENQKDGTIGFKLGRFLILVLAITEIRNSSGVAYGTTITQTITALNAFMGKQGGAVGNNLPNVPNINATLRSNHTGTQLANTISNFDAATINAMAALMATKQDNCTVITPWLARTTNIATTTIFIAPTTGLYNFFLYYISTQNPVSMNASLTYTDTGAVKSLGLINFSSASAVNNSLMKTIRCEAGTAINFASTIGGRLNIYPLIQKLS